MLDGWTRTTLGDRPADVFDPPSSLPLCVLYLHGLDERTPAADAPFTAALRAHRLRCVAPHGGPCWWADRPCAGFGPDLTPERYLRDVVVPWAGAAWHLGPRAVALAGTEMGGQGAVRLAFKYPDRFPIAASTSGAFDCQDWYGLGTPLDEMYESRERCRLDTAILHVHSHRWPPHLWFCCEPTDAACYRGNDRLHEKLAAMGVPHTADLEARGETAGPMLAFVAAALAQESKRLM